MARLNPRLAAGVGVVSLFVLLGGPGAAPAIADPGGEHSDRGNSSDRDGGSGRGGSEGDDGGFGKPDERFDAGNGGSHSGEDGTKQESETSPRVRVGSGRDDQQWLSPGGSIAAGESGASGGTGPSERSGSDHAGAPQAGFESPRVTVGNGRSPGVREPELEPRWQAPAPEPAAPPPPPPPPVAPASPPSWVDRISTPPAMTKQLGVAPAADWSQPLWGIAGLLLIPAAGAALGYRQARAAQQARKLGHA